MASMHTTARHAYHYYAIAVHTNKHFRQLSVLKAVLATFAVACFLFLRLVRCPRVLGCSLNGSISPGQADSWLKSPHDWLVSLITDLAVLSTNVLWLFSVYTEN